MSENHYQPPSAPVSSSGYSGDAGISPLVVQHLVRTQPWVRFISIAGLIFTCLILAVLIFLPVLAGSMTRRSTGVPVMTVLPAVLIGVLYIYPLVKLSMYATAIRRLRDSHSNADLEAALNHQRAFWKFIGVLFMIGIIFWLFAIFIALLSPTARYSNF